MSGLNASDFNLCSKLTCLIRHNKIQHKINEECPSVQDLDDTIVVHYKLKVLFMEVQL